MNAKMAETVEHFGEPVGLFYTWWRGDLVPALSFPSEMTIGPTRDRDHIQSATSLDAGEIQSRLDLGNSVFIARVDSDVVGYGWSTSGRVSIGELGLDFELPAGDRYLWDFVTIPAWRGKNVYPALLQAIIARESDAERFWVGHDLANVASARGIIKAGFQTVGEVYLRGGAGPVYVRTRNAPPERARAAAALLDMPYLDSTPDTA